LASTIAMFDSMLRKNGQRSFISTSIALPAAVPAGCPASHCSIALPSRTSPATSAGTGPS